MFVSQKNRFVAALVTASVVCGLSASGAWAQRYKRQTPPSSTFTKPTTITPVPLPIAGQTITAPKVRPDLTNVTPIVKTLPAVKLPPATTGQPSLGSSPVILPPKIVIPQPPRVIPGPIDIDRGPGVPPKDKERARLVLLILRELLRNRGPGPSHGGAGPIIVNPPATDGETKVPDKSDPPPPDEKTEEPPAETVALKAENDVELLEIRFVSSDAKQGPLYRLFVRNNGKTAINKMEILLTASLSRQPSKDAPQAIGRIQAIKPGETATTDVRLPVQALAMGKNSDGKAVPFTWLFAMVEGGDGFDDRSPENNLLIMNRTDIAVVEQE